MTAPSLYSFVLPVIWMPKSVSGLSIIFLFCSLLNPSLSSTLFSHWARYPKKSFSSHYNKKVKSVISFVTSDIRIKICLIFSLAWGQYNSIMVYLQTPVLCWSIRGFKCISGLLSTRQASNIEAIKKIIEELNKFCCFLCLCPSIQLQSICHRTTQNLHSIIKQWSSTH